MANHLQQVINSRAGIRLASLLGRGLPPRLGYGIANLAAGQIARRKHSNLVRGVRANQWVVHGEQLTQAELEAAVREVFRQAARATFDLYHYIHHPQAALERIVLGETVQRLIERPEFDQRGPPNRGGLVVAGLHLSAFDLALQALCLNGLKPLVLTIPDPQGGRRLEYEMRKKTGMNLLPASVGSMHQALRHLQRGGYVATGIDRPIPEPTARPLFFGRPAALPVHHIFLACKAQVPVIVMAPLRQPDGRYQFLISEAIEMEACSDRETETLRNAEKVLTIAERFIRQAPEQWTMTIPVWPEVLDNLN